MSATVVRLVPRDEDGPHVAGKALCTACRHEWVAVAPTGTTWLECPSCGTDRGLYRHPILEQGNEELIWTCACAGVIFFFTPSGAYCCGCGKRQEFP